MKQKATLISFAFRGDGPVPPSARIFDVRRVRNPWSDLALRPLNGKHGAVQDYVKADPKALQAMAMARLALASHKRIAFGCHGGKHRSVAIVELLAKELRKSGWEIDVQHTNIVDQEMVHA